MKVVSLTRKIPPEGSFLPLVCSLQTAVNFGLQKGSPGCFFLVFSREKKWLGLAARRHQGKPKSRQGGVCSWKSRPLVWVGSCSPLESPQKMFPTLISRRLRRDFLWCRKLYWMICYIHRTSSNNFGVVRVNGSNTRNYMVCLHISPLSVICRSSLFSLQIKIRVLKTHPLSCFKAGQRYLLGMLLAPLKMAEAVPGSGLPPGLLNWWRHSWRSAPTQRCYET